MVRIIINFDKYSNIGSFWGRPAGQIHQKRVKIDQTSFDWATCVLDFETMLKFQAATICLDKTFIYAESSLNHCFRNRASDPSCSNWFGHINLIRIAVRCSLAIKLYDIFINIVLFLKDDAKTFA